VKITLFLSGVFLVFTCGGISNAQGVLAPPGASDKNLEDRSIKNRSIELERIERDARKADRKKQSQSDPAAASTAKFEEVKDDFENIQRLQSEIITAYTTGKQMEYAKISSAAGQITQRASRLETNLFPVIEDPKTKKKTKAAPVADAGPPLPQDLKTLIVELDNTLAAFTGNAMFTNPQVVDTAENAKAHAALQSVIKLSAALKAAADRPVK
jgi:hypothetical protein